VVIRVFKADLNRVVIHIAHGQIGLDTIKAHALELQIGHRAGRVLREGLIDTDREFLARHQTAGHPMRRKNFFNDIFRHTLLLIEARMVHEMAVRNKPKLMAKLMACRDSPTKIV